MVADSTVTPYAQALLECLRAEMAKVEHPPASVCWRVGSRVDLLVSETRDECCEGLAWVRVASVYPSRNFPAPDATPQNCGPLQWAVVLELGAARCAPTADPAVIPSCEQWTETTRRVLDDAAAIRRAATCCFPAEVPDRMFLVGSWTPLTVEGGCVGGTMTVTLAVPACDCVEGS